MTSPNSPVALIPVTAPAALRDLPGWLMWRLEHPPGGGKPRKIPYYTSGAKRHGVQGRAEDRERLATFEAAKAAAARKGFDGVGFAPMPEWGICALDFDNCVQNGVVDPKVLDLVAGTYAEYSPSGKGVRGFVMGDLGNQKSLAVDTWGFETFSSSGFVTFTGNVLSDCQAFDAVDTIAPASAAVRELCRSRFRPVVESAEPSEPMGLAQEVIDEALEVLPNDLTYDAWIQVGMALHHETSGEGFEVWDIWSQRSPKYTTREYGLGRWESFGRRQGGPEVTIRSLVHLANQHGARINLQRQFEASAFDDLTAAVPAALRYRFESFGDFVAAPPQPYLVKGVLPQAQLAVVYGESGSGKTFAVLDLVMAIARGAEWRGRRVRQARCAYIAAEGAGGLRKRVQAYADFHGLESEALPVSFLADAPNFLLVQDVADVILGIQAKGGAGLVVVDTFAQVTPGGNENSGEDVGRVLEHCRRIHKHTGAMVLLVHHAGKDSSKGARGWSGLKAACDAELEVLRNGDDRSIRLSKAKDDADGSAWGFRLNVVSVGVDEDGDPITSCVVEVAEDVLHGRKGAGRKLRKHAVTIFRVLDDLQQLSAEAIHPETLIAAAVDQTPFDKSTGKRDERRRWIQVEFEKLLAEGELEISESMVRRAVPAPAACVA